MRTAALLVVLVACSGSSRGVSPTAVPGAWSATYEAHHRGDHPDADFTITQEIEIGELARARFVAVYKGEEFARGSVEIDRDGAPRRMEEAPLGEPGLVVTYAGTTATYRRGERTRVFEGEKLAGDPATLELGWVVTGIRAGERRDVDLVDVERETVRRFELVAEPAVEITVPAGTFEAVPVRLVARDGDARLEGTFHVRTSAPHVIVRREYVVFPETVATDPVRPTGHKQSAAIEELVELR